ncbi:MAG: protein kinase [Terracidiphilus sp.]
MTQTNKQFLLIEAIVTEALDAREELRADLIAARCGADSAMADEVRSLMDSCEAEERMMASCRLEPAPSRQDRPESKQVGPYQIDRLLGRGGMGAVYLAHRADGQFEQNVAIKLIDVPFTTDLFRERFRQERQILAGLQHPYIARLLDGGVTAEGELYLVMEYVDGVPIHRFCEDRLSSSQRIELFLRVCEAVQFAHQNFVVHRDLKPDNILVAEDGTPSLLDFGTAKLLSPSLDKPDSQLTRDGCFSFTPQYASPEQVQGNPITTASDTYSLGVLLYLLLTGEPPYDLKDLTMGQMLNTVCEVMPRRPSVIGGKRLDADLDAILSKALRKEPGERYLTAERLADDLRAYLDGLPVAARRGTARYRFGKFIRRHRWGLAASAILVTTLIAGVVGVVWQARVANQERRMAQEEQRKAEARSADLRQLSDSLLSEFDDAIQQLPGSTGVQKLLVTRVLEHLDRVAADAHGDRQTQLDLASAYTRLAGLQGDSTLQNLGDSSGALTSINKAIALSSPFASRDFKDREALHALANAQLSRSAILDGTVPIQAVIESTREAIANYDRMTALADLTPDEIFDIANGYCVLGDELGMNSDDSLNDLAGALSSYRRYLDLNSSALRLDPNLKWPKRGLALGQEKIAEIEIEIDPEQALKDIEIGLQRVAALPKTDRESLPMLRLSDGLRLDKASALAELGKYSEANSLIEGIVQSFQRLVAADSQDLRALNDLQVGLAQSAAIFDTESNPALAASTRNRRQSLSQEEKSLNQELAVLEKLIKKDPSQDSWKPFLADTQVRLGSIQFILHGREDSLIMEKKGLVTLRELASQAQASPAILDQAAQDFLNAEPASLKDPHLALSCAERTVTLSHRKLPSRLLTLAQAYRAAGQAEKSRAAAKEGMALMPPLEPGSAKPHIRKLLEIQAMSSR